MRAGGKFSPFVRLVSLIFAGSVAPGLDTPAFPSGMQLGMFVLPFRDQASSLGPSGVAYLLGVGGKFLTSLCYLRSVFLQGVPSSGFVIPASLFGAHQGPYTEPLWSDLLLGTLRGRVSIRVGGKFPPSLRLVRLFFTGSAAPGLGTPAFPTGM